MYLVAKLGSDTTEEYKDFSRRIEMYLPALSYDNEDESPSHKSNYLRERPLLFAGIGLDGATSPTSSSPENHPAFPILQQHRYEARGDLPLLFVLKYIITDTNAQHRLFHSQIRPTHNTSISPA